LKDTGEFVVGWQPLSLTGLTRIAEGPPIRHFHEFLRRASFDITNTTKFPLTLEYITTNAHGCAMTRRSDQVLAPDGASNVKGITGKLGDDQIRIYNTTKLTLVIEGAVVYENVFKKRQTQRFNAMCFGSAHSEFVFYSYAGAKESQEKAN
jgi:hypothetical protein